MTQPEDQTKPGPANPAAEGADAPTPPGGPQRQDGVGGTKDRGPAEGDAGTGSTDEDRSSDDARSSTIPIEDEAGSQAPDHVGNEEGLQQENAETALDQPST